MDIRNFRNTYAEYSPAIIWDWCAKPTAEEIDAKLNEFADMGIFKIFIRPSKGLVLPYLSDDYFELFRTAARRSGKYGIKLFICDENSASSGNGGGEITSVYDYRLKDILKVSSKDVEKTDNVLFEEAGGTTVLRDTSRVRLSGRAPLADITDAFVTECFIDAVYRKYFRECKRFLGIEIEGFSTNINLPENTSVYSPAAFKKLGTELSFNSFTENKNAYFKAFGECISDCFTGILREECNKNGLSLAVSAGGEKLISRQAQYLKGDTISLFVETENPDFVQIKLAESVSVQFEKPLNISLRLPAFSPCSERHNSAAFMSSFGASGIVYDSVAYSLSDRRKYEPHTVTVSRFAEKSISDSISRYCFTGANTLSDATLLIVYTPEKDELFKQIAEKLLFLGIPFHMAEEYIFEKYAFNSGDYLTLGKCEYTQIITMDTNYSKLDSFKGTITFAAEDMCFEEFKNDSSPDIFSDKQIIISRRRNGDDEYIFVTSTGENSKITVIPEGKHLFAADSSNGEIYKITETDGKCEFTLKAGKTAILIYSSELSADNAPPYTDDIEFTDCTVESEIPFVLSSAQENILPLKKVNACFGKKSFRENSTDNLHKEFYSLPDGETVKVKYPFNVDKENIGEVSVYIENAENLQFAELNGVKLDGFVSSPKDPCFKGTDITELVADGKNTLAIEFKKSNNYTADFSSVTPAHFYSYNITSFEPVYLCGDFDCEDDSLIRLSEYESDITSSGMSYYYGALSYAAKLPDMDLSGSILSVHGDFDICCIKIGKRSYTFFSETPMLEVFNLDCGSAAEITIYNTPYNLLRSGKDKAKPFGLTKLELCKFSY